MTDPDYVTEADIDSRPTYLGEPVTDDDLMDYDEWWAEFSANACCPDSITAARLLCGCRGSGSLPSEVSRLLAPEEEY